MLSVLITEELIQEIVGGEGPTFSSAHIWCHSRALQSLQRDLGGTN